MLGDLIYQVPLHLMQLVHKSYTLPRGFYTPEPTITYPSRHPLRTLIPSPLPPPIPPPSPPLPSPCLHLSPSWHHSQQQPAHSSPLPSVHHFQPDHHSAPSPRSARSYFHLHHPCPSPWLPWLYWLSRVVHWDLEAMREFPLARWACRELERGAGSCWMRFPWGRAWSLRVLLLGTKVLALLLERFLA